NAATRVHTVLIGLTMSAAFTPLSAASTRVLSRPELKATTSITRPMPIPFPASTSFPYRRHSGFRIRPDRRDNLLEKDSLFSWLLIALIASLFLKLFGGAQ